MLVRDLRFMLPLKETMEFVSAKPDAKSAIAGVMRSPPAPWVKIKAGPEFGLPCREQGMGFLPSTGTSKVDTLSAPLCVGPGSDWGLGGSSSVVRFRFDMVVAFDVEEYVHGAMDFCTRRPFVVHGLRCM